MNDTKIEFSVSEVFFTILPALNTRIIDYTSRAEIFAQYADEAELLEDVETYQMLADDFREGADNSRVLATRCERFVAEATEGVSDA